MCLPSQNARTRVSLPYITATLKIRNRLIMEAEAEAEAVALKGDAEAFAIEVKAKAEAEQMAKKADAWKEYKEAAMVDMMLQTLPKVGKIYLDISSAGYSPFYPPLVSVICWCNI